MPAPPWCKHFSPSWLSCNPFTVRPLQNLFFCFSKTAVLHGKRTYIARQEGVFRKAKESL
ncbi:MAG: hypothetical protein D8B57_02320 [Prevotella sp.]|nr:MAG: hypothetical protein D8B57_02320 [Prevotella sp.]